MSSSAVAKWRILIENRQKIHHHVRLVISQRLSRDSHGGRLDVAAAAAAALVSLYRMRQSDAR